MGNSNSEEKGRLEASELLKQSPFSAALQTFAGSLDGYIVTPDDKELYMKMRSRPFNIDARGFPLVIVFAKSTKDVVKCVDFMRSCGKNIPFCLYCGGNGQHCMGNKALVLDISLINDVTLVDSSYVDRHNSSRLQVISSSSNNNSSTEQTDVSTNNINNINNNNTDSAADSTCADVEGITNNNHHHSPALPYAVVGGGATVAKIDEFLATHGYVVPLGTTGCIGVGGLVLNGGFGWLTRLYGFSVDNLVQATVILANGKTIIANDNNKYHTLLWGIRGGGGNFGIVTEFVFRLHRLPSNCFCGRISYLADKTSTAINICKLFDNLVQELPSSTTGQ